MLKCAKEVREMKKCLLLGLAMVVLVGAVGISGCKGTPESSFLEMLKLVPDTPATRTMVYISDHAMIRESYDIPLPSPDADDEAIAEYIMTLAGDILEMASDPSAGRRLGETSFVSGMGPGQYAFVSPIRRHNIGFGPQDVDQDIQAGPPPMTFEATKGRYDTSVIEQAVNRYESEMPRFEQYEGIMVIDWGYGGNEIMLEKRLMPPAFDNLGRCRPLGVEDSHIFRAFDTDSIEAMIDASHGQLTSLADNPDFSLMAEGLSEMGAYSAFLTNQVLDLDRVELMVLELRESLGESVTSEEIIAGVGQLLNPYRTYAAGIGQDDEGPFMTIVLVYDSPEEASSDVPVLEQRVEKGTSVWTGEPWRDLIDSDEIWADERTLRARFRGRIVGGWLEIVYQREMLFLRR